MSNIKICKACNLPEDVCNGISYFSIAVDTLARGDVVVGTDILQKAINSFNSYYTAHDAENGRPAGETTH